ncbi:hypothetical protein JHK82_043159 [Glycine max]|nr:hypothetical protein JHK82_043159 [Glycine max]
MPEIHTHMFQGSKIGATLWQELFTELRDKLQCGSSYLIQNLRIVDNQSEYRVNPPPYLDYAIQLHDAIDKNLLLQEPLVVMLTLGKIKDAIGVSGVDGSQSQSSQSNVVENFLQNAQVVSIGEINNLRQVNS